MKRIAYMWLAVLMVGGILVAPSRAQNDSLGDYARGVRKQKDEGKAPTSAKKYDNDNLPRNETLSIVGNAPADDKAANASSAAKVDEKPSESKDDQQKALEDWKKKIGDQKDQIDLQTRELDVLQREYRLRTAAFYADAGARLRNSGQWDKQDAQYKQQIADRQKALDANKKQLDDLQEQARKAGMPASARQ